MADVESRVSLVKQSVELHPVPEFDGTPHRPDVVIDERTGKVETVRMDRPVLDPTSPLAVQIPPEADGSSQNVLGVLAEPTPEHIFANPNATENENPEAPDHAVEPSVLHGAPPASALPIDSTPAPAVAPEAPAAQPEPAPEQTAPAAPAPQA